MDKKGGRQYILNVLLHRNITPTPTRILILRQMYRGDEMVSLPELERLLPSVDKSTISRALNLFLAHGLIHAVDDGSGSVKYNVCPEDCECEDIIEDEHTHFYCTECHRAFCLTNIHVPVVELPDGFHLHSINYVLKGICPECSMKTEHR
ncbi:Fur family transcriptional regulator [Prevotella sp. OH937_COT-195]|uniref:Fur family transcriptional regulator n=1 Tax=Prevotella sp. OH937_COT-195 TaxID=2491051 RepID=UPI000F64618E|nr:transcriptional repressor [Prevotella sp. OH937_COT-195]RRC98729.1 transcriptional repressor [Prevotella sp. OH937_COT-195]